MIATALTVDASSRRSRPKPATPRALVFHCTDPQAAPAGHDLQTKTRVAEGLARLLGCEFAGEFDARNHAAQGLYFVPSNTLCDLATARRMGIRDIDDLFGGVVPLPFVATKLISHPLLASDSPAPPGWAPAFAERARSAVLPGFSVFRAADARQAAARLLEQGSVRLKDPSGVGGLGQWVVGSGAELEARLKEIGSDALWRRGLVLEKNLKKVVTYSVGQVQVGEFVASYHGIQNTTRNHDGAEVYGGSDLVVARGGFDQLLSLALEPGVRLAVQQALAYHRAALATYRGMFVSRCNYDVAHGIDEAGVMHSGVLEQSWRIGGASGAEVAALLAFAADASLQTVHASTCERYGGDDPVPAGAWLLFDGVDERAGHVTKYALAAAHADD